MNKQLGLSILDLSEFIMNESFIENPNMMKMQKIVICIQTAS